MKAATEIIGQGPPIYLPFLALYGGYVAINIYKYLVRIKVVMDAALITQVI
jgi:hypothetical protein